VEKQGKACRKTLERALTRAAMDQDLGAIDEAEVVLSQKEHKLERLLTQKNMFEAALVRAYLTGTDRNSQCMLARHYSIICFAMASCSIEYTYQLPKAQCLDQDTQLLDLPALDAWPRIVAQLVVQASSMHALTCICSSSTGRAHRVRGGSLQF